MSGLNEENLEMLKNHLGRDVSEEVGSCRDYMDVYNLHIDDLRELVRRKADLHAARYIMHLLGKVDLQNAKTFIYFVIKDGVSADYWLERIYRGN